MLSARRERELDRGNCGRPQSAGRLRSRTATRLNGDPQDLIRAMPAKGDRPAGPCLTGKASATPVPGARPGESSYGRPRLAWPPARSAPAPGRTGAPHPGRARRRQRRGPGRRPDRGSAGSSPRSTRSLSRPTLACHRRWPPGSRCRSSGPAGWPQGSGPCRPVPEEAERSAAGADRGSELRPAPRLWPGFPRRAVTAGPLPCSSALALISGAKVPGCAGASPLGRRGQQGHRGREGKPGCSGGRQYVRRGLRGRFAGCGLTATRSGAPWTGSRP
jgi:hypothetical protein